MRLILSPAFVKLVLTGVLFFCHETMAFSQKQKVWIDADTGNETDDVYAIARLLADTTIQVIGLSAAHFNNADLVAFSKWNQYNTKEINTVQISQQLNEELLQVMGKTSIPHPIGADRQMGRAWGGREPRKSAAAMEIINAVKNLDSKEKLVVITLGALTNIASAIALDTGIAKQMICYALGAKYNVDKSIWNKSEFNIRNDLNAFDYLLDNSSVNLVLLPVDVALPYRFKRDSLYEVLNSDVPLQHLLKQRWAQTNPQDEVRTLWDLALVEAFLNPSFAQIKKVLTPPENRQRMIMMYIRIDVAKMTMDFFRVIRSNGHY